MLTRVLILIFLANLLGVATVESASDEHEVGVAHSHGQEPAKDPAGKDFSPCEHACHIGFHFMGLPGTALRIAAAEACFEVSSLLPTTRSASLPSLFHPPRSLV